MSSKAAVLIFSLGAINIAMAGIVIYAVLSDRGPDEAPEPATAAETRSPVVVRSARDAEADGSCSCARQLMVERLLRQRANLPDRRAAFCQAEVERYRQMLEDIQHWCNPYCQDELDECRLVLTDRSSTSYPRHFPGALYP